MFTLTMPKLSPTMESGTIVKWRKAVGDLVKPGDVVIEVATDKATVEHAALDGGYLRKILVSEGREARVNEDIAIFTEKADESIESYQPPKAEVVSVAVATESTKEKKAEAPKSALAQPVFALEPPLEGWQPMSEEISARIAASPLAKKLAKEHGLDLSTVQGSGPHGRVVASDLQLAQKEGLAVFGSRKKPDAAPGSYTEKPLTPMRKSIAKRLQESKTFIPHFYVEMSVDAERLVALREELKATGIKLTVNDFVVKAVAMALKEHPALNAAYQSDNIAYFNTVDIAVAVSIEGGLITPIIRCADYKNIGEIATEIRALAERAKAGQLEPHEYKGGSFTISNLGMMGVDRFGAIINPPQAGILAVGGILDVPVVRKGAVVPGKVMNLTLSVDHRIVDGTDAAAFLKTLKTILENPTVLIIR